MFGYPCFKRAISALALGVALGACVSPSSVSVDGPPASLPATPERTLAGVLRFAASLRELALADQRALIDVYSSHPEGEASAEDAVRLALLYLNASARPAELARAEALLADVVARAGDGDAELATFARLLLDALHVLTPPATAASVPPAVTVGGDAGDELAAVRRELEAERARRARLEAQLEALLQLELELGAAGDRDGSQDGR